MNEALIEKKSQELLSKIKAAKPNITVMGTTYYVSNEGDDKANGLSPETAWQTIERVNQNYDNYKEGDAVLFRCGDTFRGSIKVRGITYSSYGEGEKPHMYASPFNAAEKTWTNEGNDIYSIPYGDKNETDPVKKIHYDIGNIVFNHGKDSCGFKKWSKIGTELEFDLDFYHNLDEGKLYLKSTQGDPSKRWESIELSLNVPVFEARIPECNNSTIDGFVIKYSGSCSISFSGYCVENSTVRNCEFEWIGGSIMSPYIVCRFGNAYQIWGGCNGVLIENCYFNQTYDAAVTPQWFGNGDRANVINFVVRGCLFERNVYDLEYFLTERIGENTNDHKKDTTLHFENMIFENNICRLNGYGFGSHRPYRPSASMIKGWKHQNKATAGTFIIRNNIFDRADYLLIEACADEDEWLPVFENNVYCQFREKGLYDVNGRVNFNDSIYNTRKIPIDKGAIIVDAHRPVSDNNNF